MSSPHVVALPRWFLLLRIFQILTAVAVMGMSAYGIYWVPYNSWCLALFTSIATFIVVFYSLLTYHVEDCQAAYNYWAVLALDIFAIVFWLSSMGCLAATRGAFIYDVTFIDCLDYGYGAICYKKRDNGLTKRDIATVGYLDMMSASAGLAGLEVIFFIVSLAIFAVHMHRHRASGAPNTPSPGVPNTTSPGAPNTTSPGAPNVLSPSKLEGQPVDTMSDTGAQQPQQQPQYALPSQQYPQQQQQQPQYALPGQQVPQQQQQEPHYAPSGQQYQSPVPEKQ